MENIKNLIFDFDGVVLDSVKVKDNSFKKLAKKYKKNIRQKFYIYHKKNLGFSRENKFKYLFTKLLKKKYSTFDKKKINREFVQINYKEVCKCKFVLGVKKFLLSNKKLNLFISSGTPEKELKLLCKERNISHIFVKILGSPKTKKKHISNLKVKYKVNSTNTLFFGDSTNDYSVAKQLKLNFVQVGNNFKRKNVKLKIKNFKGKTLNKINDHFKRI